jgi:hypothetical protein
LRRSNDSISLEMPFNDAYERRGGGGSNASPVRHAQGFVQMNRKDNARARHAKNPIVVLLTWSPNDNEPAGFAIDLDVTEDVIRQEKKPIHQ